MRVRVTFIVELPSSVDATYLEVRDWLRFYLHDTGSLDGTNPLIDHDPEPVRGSFYVSDAP
jgi:hypothetical protein